MKRTLRSLLSMVMALSMLLSMVLISGLTASAANVYLGAEAFAAGSVVDGYVFTPDATGNGFTLSVGPGLAASGYAGVLSVANTNAMPYLVITVDSVSAGGAWSIDGLATGWQSTGTFVLDTSASDEIAGILWMTGGTSFHVQELYFSDTNPNDAPQSIPLASLAAGYNNTALSVAGADSLGATMSQPWTTAEGFGYTYWNITLAQISATPYLVVDIADESLAQFAGHCGVTYGWAGAELVSLRSADMKVIDLSTVATDNNVCVCFTFYSDVAFDALYLTNVEPSVPTNKYPVKDMTVSLGNVTPTASGEGVIFTVPDNATGDQYAYYERIPAPYLVYKLKEGSPSSQIVIAADAWWGGFVSLPAPSTTEMVVDLSTLPCYSASSNMLLQNLFTATTEFEEFYFTTEATPNVHYITVNTNGGSAVPSGFVGTGVQLGISSVKDGYVLEGWYTDAALTEKFDLATPVTSSMTLYAKWTLAGVISPVFGQLQAGTTAESDSAAIRFSAVIDSRDFAEAGFVFSKVTATPTVDDAYSLAVSTTTVWTSINAAGSTVTAEELHGSYIFACTVNNISNANFGTELYVRAYVKDFEGNYTYTDAKTYSVTDMLG